MEMIGSLKFDTQEGKKEELVKMDQIIKKQLENIGFRRYRS